MLLNKRICPPGRKTKPAATLIASFEFIDTLNSRLVKSRPIGGGRCVGRIARANDDRIESKYTCRNATQNDDHEYNHMKPM